MKTHNININDESLSYLDNKKGDTTLLFIHGAFISKEYWIDQLLYFAPNYRVLAIDLSGHGNSTYNRTEWTNQTFGKDISMLIKKLSLTNVILIGHSFGTDVMLETVAIDASIIKGLISIDHLKNVGVALPQETIDYLIESLETDFEKTCEQYARQALVTEETQAEIVKKLLSDYMEMNPEVGRSMLQNGFNYTHRETMLLEGLKHKLYLLHVNYTPTNEENLKKYLGDNYELQTISGTCHYPMLENPSEFNALLEKIVLKINSTL